MPRAGSTAPVSTTLDALRYGAAAAYLPGGRDMDELQDAAAGCRGCELWRRGTQTVFGEGPPHAPLILVGEQPGDVEDVEGRPFVGPAGRLLDRVLAEAGVDRSQAYVTNAVKHFKWEARGKRRIHQKPRQDEIDACGPWLASEIEAVRPKVLVCLGATAAQALLGRSFRVTKRRGEVIEGADLAPYVMATVHPSSVLRASSAEARRQAEAAMADDLRQIVALLESDQ